MYVKTDVMLTESGQVPERGVSNNFSRRLQDVTESVGTLAFSDARVSSRRAGSETPHLRSTRLTSRPWSFLMLGRNMKDSVVPGFGGEEVDQASFCQGRRMQRVDVCRGSALDEN